MITSIQGFYYVLFIMMLLPGFCMEDADLLTTHQEVVKLEKV